MGFRTGSFDKSRVHAAVQPFVPAHAVSTLQEIDLDALWESGKRLILVDVDNTIVAWKTEEFTEPVLEWMARAKQMGFEICIISNTNRVDRLQRLADRLQVQVVRGRFKPSRAMFRLALIKFQRKPEEAIMIGDQMMTDILGANRSGIEAIWVRKMEGREFTGTKINRFVEGILRGPVYKALITPIDEQPDPDPIEQAKPLEDRAVVHQFIRFVIVGGTSFIVDFGILWLLRFVVTWDGVLLSQIVGTWLQQTMPTLFAYAHTPADASIPPFKIFAAGVAILNSFVWNRMWTFSIRGREERMAQLRRFYVVALIGLALNTILVTVLHNVIPARPTLSLAIAQVVAAGVVAVWNFTGQRFYAFKVHRRKA
jgi:uncharacterized protein